MLSAQSTNTITNGFSNMAAFPRVMSYMIEKFDYTGPLPPWKEQQFFFPNGMHTLDTDLLPLHAILLSKVPSVDSQNALSVINNISDSIASG